MDFLKKHYEKIILGAVLLGMLIAVGLLPLKISAEKEQQDEQRKILQPNAKPLDPLVLTREEAAIKRLKETVTLDLTAPHNVINPVPWFKNAQGTLIKQQFGREIGPSAVTVSNIQPLFLILTYDGTSGNGYLIGVERQAAFRPADRRKQQRLVSTASPKSDLFSLVEVKGAAENPTELVLELVDSQKRIPIGPGGKEFRQREGFSADLRYSPENRFFPGVRVGSPISIGGDEYNVVAITETDVVLSAKPTGKKTTVQLNPGSSTR